MSTPTDSVAPTTPTGTSMPWPLWDWIKKIADWLRGLSPAGADKYDTGWVVVNPSAGFTADAIHVRRIGMTVHLRVQEMTRTSGSGTATAFTLPAGYRPSAEEYPAWSSPSPNHITWLTPAGEMRGAFTTSGNRYRLSMTFPAAA